MNVAKSSVRFNSCTKVGKSPILGVHETTIIIQDMRDLILSFLYVCNYYYHDMHFAVNQYEWNILYCYPFHQFV